MACVPRLLSAATCGRESKASPRLRPRVGAWLENPRVKPCVAERLSGTTRRDATREVATRGPSTKVINHAWERNRVRTREGFKARHAWLKSGHAWFRVGACSTTRGFAFRMLRPRVANVWSKVICWDHAWSHNPESSATRSSRQSSTTRGDAQTLRSPRVVWWCVRRTRG